MSLVSLKHVISRFLPSLSNPNTTTTTENSPLLGANTSSTMDINSSGTIQEYDTTSEDMPMLQNHTHYDQDRGFINLLFGKMDPRIMSDLIIGLSDGLTVPFALTAGLSSLGDSKLVITGGFAELISGTISMGLGGYLGAKSEADYYHNEVNLEKRKFYDGTSNEVNHDVEDILLEINPDFSEDTILNFIKDLQKNPELMVDFIIKYGRGLDEPAENRALTSCLTIGAGYFFGGFIPLIPYFFVNNVVRGLIYSVIVMTFTLFWFGYIKAQLTMSDMCTLNRRIYEGFQMVSVGGIAAGAAWFFVKLIEEKN
ncbi:Ccc1p SCDLUD_001909 [Saccharomycodes ludwigii]|uniref:Ccc1p n=1 Tax=Saccharomycodes ludwigii TaxID=36035 RepID=UPI001E8A71F1|nr:hypothetical protein SCDLUD_001909 [Saccharomycodes ludwigii]KAH3902096.1 hypothetical protein SCDLUD_001909 [Saccharomycodes ludwigii]